MFRLTADAPKCWSFTLKYCFFVLQQPGMVDAIFSQSALCFGAAKIVVACNIPQQ